MRTTGSKLTLIVATLIAAVVVAGCGGGEPNLEAGKNAFITQCAECHQLQDARSGGKIGPDLDAAFAAALAAGEGNDTVEGVVAAQIAEPRSIDPKNPTYMPADLVEGDDARNVAAYVASVAGNPNVSTPPTPQSPGAQVFATQGCAACHSFVGSRAGAEVGPNLDTVLLGQSRSMIEESIIHPNANITAGYPAGVMPELFGSDINPTDLEELVSYLKDTAGKTNPALADKSDPSATVATPGTGSGGGGKGSVKALKQKNSKPKG